MELTWIYSPIEKELKEVEVILEKSLRETKNESIQKINRSLLESPGKRIRPALVILAYKATLSPKPFALSQLIKISSSIELIHIASLIHDDVMDHARLRHNRPTVNYKWGNDVAIASGDY
ncbi:MAG: polyprenyl synthetase family protein, partial [Candidatus Omnitrophica bacterium]|nr:polyprenyl synthetase family protein [Candidatus Omnitrophota bacterium]